MNASSPALEFSIIGYASPGNIIAASVVLPALCTLTLCLRFYVRLSYHQPVKIDDWLLLPALVMIIGMGTSLIIGVSKHAIGYPTPALSDSTPESFLSGTQPQRVISEQVEYTATLLLIVAYGLIKLSILFFYRRLFVTHHNTTFNNILWVTIAIIIAWIVGFLLGFLANCRDHFTAPWGPRKANLKYCPNGRKLEDSLYISEFITTIIILVLPWAAIWSLQLKTSRKLGICAILLLAFIAIAASIVRLIIVIQVDNKKFAQAFDQDRTISTIFYWSMIEAGLAFFASCLPSIRILVAHKKPSRTTRGSETTSPTYGWFSMKPLRTTEKSPKLSSTVFSHQRNAYSQIGTPKQGVSVISNGVPFDGDASMETDVRPCHIIDRPAPIKSRPFQNQIGDECFV